MKKRRGTLVSVQTVKCVVLVVIFMLCVGGISGNSPLSETYAAVKKYKEYDTDELLIYHRNLMAGTNLKAMKLPKGKWTKVKSGKNKGKYYFKQKKEW